MYIYIYILRNVVDYLLLTHVYLSIHDKKKHYQQLFFFYSNCIDIWYL